jgi:hypothetical protein
VLDADGEEWPGSFDAVDRPIDSLLERLARCEADHPPGRYRRRGPGLGVASDARPLGADLPRAKAAHDHGKVFQSCGCATLSQRKRHPKRSEESDDYASAALSLLRQD